MSGFEEAGIWPTTAKPVIASIIKKQRQLRKAIHPSIMKLLPVDTRFQDAQDQMERIYERYQHVMSSPTLDALTNVRNAVTSFLKPLLWTENVRLLKQTALAVSRDMEREGITVPGLGQAVISSPVSDFLIFRLNQAALAAAEVKQQRSHLRLTRSIIIQEMKALKALWKEEIESRVTQGQPKLTWNQWLDQTDNRP